MLRYGRSPADHQQVGETKEIKGAQASIHAETWSCVTIALEVFVTKVKDALICFCPLGAAEQK